MKKRIAIRISAIVFALAVGFFGSASALAAPVDAFPHPSFETSTSQPADKSAPPAEGEETAPVEEPETPEALLPEEPIHLSAPSGVLFTFIAILAVVVRVVAKKGGKDKNNDEDYNESYY